MSDIEATSWEKLGLAQRKHIVVKARQRSQTVNKPGERERGRERRISTMATRRAGVSTAGPGGHVSAAAAALASISTAFLLEGNGVTFPPNLWFLTHGCGHPCSAWLWAQTNTADAAQTDVGTEPDCLLTIGVVKITTDVQIQQISSAVPNARQWNQSVRSSILIMIVTCAQTGANQSSASWLWHPESGENSPVVPPTSDFV